MENITGLISVWETAIELNLAKVPRDAQIPPQIHDTLPKEVSRKKYTNKQVENKVPLWVCVHNIQHKVSGHSD